MAKEEDEERARRGLPPVPREGCWDAGTMCGARDGDENSPFKASLLTPQGTGDGVDPFPAGGARHPSGYTERDPNSPSGGEGQPQQGKKKGKKAMHDLGPEAAARVQSQVEESIPIIVDVMWSISVLDIEKTLASACQKVLDDHDVSPEEITRRAQGLSIIGECFLEEAVRQDEMAAKAGEAGEEAGPRAPSAKEMVEDAMRRTMMRKMQQEESDEAPMSAGTPGGAAR